MDTLPAADAGHLGGENTYQLGPLDGQKYVVPPVCGAQRRARRVQASLPPVQLLKWRPREVPSLFLLREGPRRAAALSPRTECAV